MHACVADIPFASAFPPFFSVQSGRKHIGKISGIGYSSLVIGSALGPLPLGIVPKSMLNHVLLAMSTMPIFAGMLVACCRMKPHAKMRVGANATGGKDGVEMERLLGEEEDGL